MPTVSKATQDFVPIKEVRNGVVVLKDNSLRAILMASSLNFALKAEDNQQAIIFQFQNLLNSLDFSTQIFIQSRKLDIRPYLALLDDRYKKQTNDLMKIQTREYVEFIKAFTENTNIMTKTFFVVIPYSPPILKQSNPFVGKIMKAVGRNTVKEKVAAESEEFEEYRVELEQRIAVIEEGLTRIGIRVAMLGTDEIVELFYKLFNPGETEKPIQIS